MKLTIGRLMLAIIVTSANAALAADPAAEGVVHAAIDAHGGEQALRGLRNVEFSAVGYRNMVEQSERPEGPYVTEFD